jgi:hypothetical protein
MADEQTENTPKPTTASVRDERTPYSSYLVDIDRGRVESDATDRLAEAVQAVENTGSKATVIVTITIEPQDPKTFDETGILVVTGDAKATLPRVKRPASIFYATGVGGGMTRQDPSRDDPRFD